MKSIDRERLARWFDQYAQALVLYARQWSPAPEDVVHEAFIKLASQRREPDNVAAWLYRVVRNGAISWARGDARRRERERRAASDVNWFEPVQSGLDATEVSRLLTELSDELREVLVARIWGGLTFDQIAELTQSSSSTTHRRYAEALVQLRERMGISCPDPHRRTNPS